MGQNQFLVTGSSKSYLEKRSHIRMPIETQIEIMRDNCAEKFSGITKNLSADGLSFTSSTAFTEHELLEVTVNASAISSPAYQLHGQMRVTRCEALSEENQFLIAGKLFLNQK